jgi:serine/threonine protein kinase
MGALYLAADTAAFDRPCVVKELWTYYNPSDAAEARKARERFEAEGRVLANLSHPGIPRIYTYFAEAGRHFIVMEYIEGETLETAVSHYDAAGQEVRARPLPAETVVRHAIRICRVLEYLEHQRPPVVHNDIKPANLIVESHSGEIYLVDFGTAKRRVTKGTRGIPGPAASSVYGTEGYAPPELYQGRSAPRSDVYALAATIYHLLTDDDPRDHPFRFPKLKALPKGLSGALDRALRPQPDRRSTAQELRQALEGWLIPDEGGQPFVFRSGAVARTSEDLVALAEQHWEEARQHLQGGDFEAWFRSRNRHDLVAKSASARLEGDPDAALEAFLVRLNPRLPPPELAVSPTELDFGALTRDRIAGRSLTFENVGRGYGRVTVQPSVPWLQVEPEAVGCRAAGTAQVIVRANAQVLPIGRRHGALLTCIPNRGARLSVPVQVQTPLGREAARRLALAGRRAVPALGRGVRQGVETAVGLIAWLLETRAGWAGLGVGFLALLVGFFLLWSGGGLPEDWAQVPGLLLRSAPLALASLLLLPAGLVGLTVGLWHASRAAVGALIRGR